MSYGWAEARVAHEPCAKPAIGTHFSEIHLLEMENSEIHSVFGQSGFYFKQNIPSKVGSFRGANVLSTPN